ncbi:MAG: putative toxin-antitoxin system toxin component, PIN family [Nitrospirae bacterium]|nr:putative toxin-antitoxin system toxin component, PIN family [Nitrospirota bacterium]
MRVVFDTNIFISALVIPGGQTEKAISRITSGADTLLISKAIIDEVLSVLYNKFGRDIEAISHTAVFLSELGEMVHKTSKIRILQDDPDNRILECALSGKADIIVTGDKEMLGLKEYKGVKIISLREFLEA